MKTHELFEQETPKKLKLPKHNKPIWVAIAVWTHEYFTEGYKTKVFKTTASKIQSDYKKWATINKIFPMYGIFTNIHYQTKYRRVFEQAINSPSGGELSPSGDYQGFAVSFKSAADARARANDLSIQYEKAEREKAVSERQVLKKRAATLKVDPGVAKKLVYYSFVIEHERGIQDGFSGKVPLSVFVDLEIAYTTYWRKRANEIFDERVNQLAPNVQYADLVIRELLEENNGQIVNKLLKRGMVSSVGEMGYGVLSLSSVSAAEKEIKRLLSSVSAAEKEIKRLYAKHEEYEDG